MRKLTHGFAVPLLHSDFRVVRLNFPFVEADVKCRTGGASYVGEFLEGLDIPGEESFEDWLRDMRSNFFDNAREGNGENSADDSHPVIASLAG